MPKSKEITLNVPLQLDFVLLRCQVDALRDLDRRLMPQSPLKLYLDGVIELFCNIQQYALQKGVPRAMVYGPDEPTKK